MSEHRNEAIRLLLEKTLNRQNYFSICAIDNIGESLGVNPSQSKHYKTLSLLHCVSYSEMSADLKGGLQEMIVDCLTGSSNVDGIMEALAPQQVKSNRVIEGTKLFRIGK